MKSIAKVIGILILIFGVVVIAGAVGGSLLSILRQAFIPGVRVPGIRFPALGAGLLVNLLIFVQGLFMVGLGQALYLVAEIAQKIEKKG